MVGAIPNNDNAGLNMSASLQYEAVENLLQNSPIKLADYSIEHRGVIINAADCLAEIIKGKEAPLLQLDNLCDKYPFLTEPIRPGTQDTILSIMRNAIDAKNRGKFIEH